jgi:His-Xaa-Ser system protein HxsD
MSTTLPWAVVVSEAELTITLSTAIFELPAIERACYWMTDRCYVRLEPGEMAGEIRARLASKLGQVNLHELVGEFGNRLLDEQLRLRIGEETRTVRELIVAQAFAEADLDQVASDPSRPIEPER